MRQPWDPRLSQLSYEIMELVFRGLIEKGLLFDMAGYPLVTVAGLTTNFHLGAWQQHLYHPLIDRHIGPHHLPLNMFSLVAIRK